MTKEELIDLYDPKKAKDLTQEQKNALSELTTEEIGILAEAYPNGPGGNFLILEDTRRDAKQLYPTSTFKNLYDLRSALNQTYFRIFSFKSNFKPAVSAPTAPVQDLTKTAAANAPGLKVAETQNLKDGGITSTPVTNPNERKVLQADLDLKPELIEQGVKVGDDWKDEYAVANIPELSEEEKQQQAAAQQKAAKNGRK